jgi:hypothetical protein
LKKGAAQISKQQTLWCKMLQNKQQQQRAKLPFPQGFRVTFFFFSLSRSSFVFSALLSKGKRLDLGASVTALVVRGFRLYLGSRLRLC